MAKRNKHVDLDMNGNAILDVKDPLLDQDAATKKYVDDNVGGGSSEEFTADYLKYKAYFCIGLRNRTFTSRDVINNRISFTNFITNRSLTVSEISLDMVSGEGPGQTMRYVIARHQVQGDVTSTVEFLWEGPVFSTEFAGVVIQPLTFTFEPGYIYLIGSNPTINTKVRALAFGSHYQLGSTNTTQANKSEIRLSGYAPTDPLPATVSPALFSYDVGGAAYFFKEVL